MYIFKFFNNIKISLFILQSLKSMFYCPYSSVEKATSKNGDAKAAFLPRIAKNSSL